MSKLYSNLGRGLGDMISEVSTVKAVHAPVPEKNNLPPATPKPRPASWLVIALIVMTVIAAGLAWKVFSLQRAEPPPIPAKSDISNEIVGRVLMPGVNIERGKDLVRISFDRPAFVSGTVLAPDSALDGLAHVLATVTHPIEITVLGHATREAMPPGSAYRTSDDLAFARAVTVVNQLRAQGVTLDMKAGIGPAPFPAGDPQARSRNRSVSIELRELTTRGETTK